MQSHPAAGTDAARLQGELCPMRPVRGFVPCPSGQSAKGMKVWPTTDPGAMTMDKHFSKRDFIKLAGLGGVVFASALRGGIAGAADAPGKDDFTFVQLSDTHWGFNGAAANPDAQGTLKKAVAAVNSLDQKPDFVVFTGDLTHTTDDPKIRRDRLAEFRDIVGGLNVKTVRFMPGEHDASLDEGEAYQQLFGKTYYTFDHKGVHFIAIDNVSDAKAVVGEGQLKWLEADLKQLRKDQPIVVFTHRPLFDLYPQWDWTTKNAAAVMSQLMPYTNVTVFYGHIHQEHHQMTGHIAHHAAKSLIFPLPPPGSQPKRAPIPWDAAQPYRGMGFRRIAANPAQARYDVTECPVLKG
jgi:predicted phosphodiesterase